MPIITLPLVDAACILCLVAADTCFQEQVVDAAGSYNANSSKDGDVPQATRGKSASGIKVLGMITLNDFDKLEFESKSGRGYIACTTDAIFLDKPLYYDLVIDLRFATTNTRPAFFVSRPVELPSRCGPSFRLSSICFTWRDGHLVSASCLRLSSNLLVLTLPHMLDPTHRHYSFYGCASYSSCMYTTVHSACT